MERGLMKQWKPHQEAIQKCAQNALRVHVMGTMKQALKLLTGSGCSGNTNKKKHDDRGKHQQVLYNIQNCVIVYTVASTVFE